MSARTPPPPPPPPPPIGAEGIDRCREFYTSSSSTPLRRPENGHRQEHRAPHARRWGEETVIDAARNGGGLRHAGTPWRHHPRDLKIRAMAEAIRPPSSRRLHLHAWPPRWGCSPPSSAARGTYVPELVIPRYSPYENITRTGPGAGTLVLLDIREEEGVHDRQTGGAVLIDAERPRDGM